MKIQISDWSWSLFSFSVNNDFPRSITKTLNTKDSLRWINCFVLLFLGVSQKLQLLSISREIQFFAITTSCIILVKISIFSFLLSDSFWKKNNQHFGVLHRTADRLKKSKWINIFHFGEAFWLRCSQFHALLRISKKRIRWKVQPLEIFGQNLISHLGINIQGIFPLSIQSTVFQWRENYSESIGNFFSRLIQKLA